LVKAANWLGHLQFDLESPIFRHWTRELSRYNEYVRYDDRGCGLSDRDVKSSTFQDWVDDLESIVDSAGLEKFALLGISQGGAVSIAYAARHPGRVSHLILYGASALGWSKIHTSPAEQEEGIAMLTLTRAGWGKDNPAYRQIFTSLFVPGGTPEQASWFNELMRKSTSPETAVRYLMEFAQIDVLDQLDKVSAPTLVIHTRGDQVNRFEDGRDLATLIRGAHFIPLESKNHILLEDEPAWKDFLAETRRFLGVKETGPEPSPKEKELGVKAWLRGPKK
jgi:pimeloyl-ACP methyl ester carboxylesterase